MFNIFNLLTLGSRLSPAIRTQIRNLVDGLSAEAAKTPGTADDLALAVLRTVLMILGIYN